MNCANHSERTATAFCQNCGKALCPECTRSDAATGLILCEPCLLARQPGATPGTSAPGAVPYTPVAGGGTYPAPGYSSQPSPFLAGMLGFIPGVGAMYNGQFIKGLIHVVVFIVLIGLTGHFPPLGMLIAAWVFYQVFDAAQTAAARRDGRPLPDPFGLLDLSQRMGPAATYPGATYPGAGAQPPYQPPYQAPAGGAAYTGPGTPPAGAPYTPPAPGYGAPFTPAGGYAAPHQPGPGQAVPGQTAPFTPVSGAYTAMPPEAYMGKRRGEPVGAIILIALGVLFLLNTLDVLNFDWISRGWPVLLLGLGIWQLIRRANRGGYGTVPPPPYAPPGSYPAGPAAATETRPAPKPGTGLSIYPSGERGSDEENV